MQFISVKSLLPNSDELVLVRGAGHSGIALAYFDFDSRKWQVQPFGTAWYETKTAITEWAYVNNNVNKCKGCFNPNCGANNKEEKVLRCVNCGKHTNGTTLCLECTHYILYRIQELERRYGAIYE